MIPDNESMTIRQLIDRMAEIRPEQTFLLSSVTEEVITFRALREGAKLLASELLCSGLEFGDKVAFLLDNGLFAARLFLGVMYGGFVAVPLNVRAGVAQLAYTLDHCDAKVVYVGREYCALIDEVTANVPRDVGVILADPDGVPNLQENALVSPDLAAPTLEDAALLMYTSGSTGQPKAAVHSHRSILAGARNTVAAHQLSSSDRSLLVLPLYHINAECVTLIPTLMSGGSVVVPHRFSVSQFWDWLDEYKCTWSAIVPTMVSQLLDWQDPRAESRGATFQRIRFLRSSSAPLAPSLHREFLDKFPLLLIQAMGSSEAGNVFSNPLPPGENKIGSPGVPWGFEVRIVNPTGSEVSPGESGEMLIRGPAMMRRYYKQPEETEGLLDAEGWLHTGDLAYRDEDGYFFVVGRSKELIIKGGVNIAPRQIDDVLESHPAVLEAAAIGVPDHYMGEDLVAFVVLRAGITIDNKQLLSFCEARLGHFKTPTRIYFADDLPKGPSGKVQRLQLHDKARELASGIGGPSPSEFKRTNGNTSRAGVSIEQIIAESWATVLSLRHVDSDSNFFALGGDSLNAIQCISLLRDRIPIALSLSDFFENTTVAQQSALVTLRLRVANGETGQTFIHQSASIDKALKPVTSAAIPLRDRTLPCPLSPGQRRLWFLEQLNPGAAYNEWEAFRLHGELNVEAMEQALNVIVTRHEVLRTTIRVMDNEPVAVVHESWPLQIKKIDLTALPPESRRREAERLVAEEPKLPYNLETAPGIRFALISLDPHEHILILMMHHIIADWSSEGILWRELACLYDSFCCGEPYTLPPLAIQHGDYAAWQAQRHQETSFDEDLAYWEANLRDAPQLLDLPADRTRPPMPSYRGARQRIFLGPSITKALRDLSKRAETTLFNVFAAALSTLFYRYTGKEDILLGIPIADRDRKELQSVIGFLLQTHVLRTDLSGDITFRELLTRVQKAALGLYLHRAVPFDQVVSKLRPERNLSYSPLFQVMLITRDPDQLLSVVGLKGLAIEPVFASDVASKFDLTLFVTDCGDQIWLEAEYSTDLFDEARIERMLNHYRTLLDSAAGNPDCLLAKLSLLTYAEQQILVDWNRTARAYPDRILHELIEEQVVRTPDAVAAVFEDDQLTYRQLDDRANLVARHLRKLGVGPNVLVGICVERSLDMLVGLLGILKAGGAYVPLDPAFPADRLAFMLGDFRPRVLLSQKRVGVKLPPHQAQVVWLDALPAELQKTECALMRSGCRATDLAYVLYTSGSTGKPKGVQISNRAVVNLLSAMRREPGLLPDDTLLAVTTLSFDIAGLELFLPLISGARVVIASREATADGTQLAALMNDHGVTMMQATPATWRLLLEAGWTGSPTLKILCGGEAWRPTLGHELLSRCKSLWNMYGPTETTIWSAVARVEADQPILIGLPIANTEFYVLDTSQQVMPIGVPGELCIGGDGLAEGYFNKPDLTNERFISNSFSDKFGARLYRTGDVVRRLADGMIEFHHRNDHQVKIRGFRIELEEIEAALKQHSGVAECVVVALGDVGEEKILAAYVVPVPQSSILRTIELRTFLKEKLPGYMVPATFTVLERLPLTPNCKIDRKALTTAQYFPSEPKLEESSIPPQTLLELHLQKIWERVLNLRTVNVRDSFFNLGGHSLLVIKLIGEINRSLNVCLTPQIFFLNPTIKGIAEVLEEGTFAKPGPQVIPLRQLGTKGAIFFLDASMALCRLGQLLDVETSIFATDVPISSAAYRAAVLDGTSPLPQLEDLAAGHVALIRSQQFSGPCVLAGHSFGGLLAFEVAHQLRREGTNVEMVLLVDSWLTIPPRWHKLKLLPSARAGRALLRRLDRLLSKVRSWWHGTSPVLKFQPALVSGFEQIDQPVSGWPVEVFQKIAKNVRKSYRWRPLQSRAVLFRSQDILLDSIVPTDGTVGWGSLFAGGLEIVEVPGDHFSLIQDPHILITAQKVNECVVKFFPSNSLDRSHGLISDISREEEVRDSRHAHA